MLSNLQRIDDIEGYLPLDVGDSDLILLLGIQWLENLGHDHYSESSDLFKYRKQLSSYYRHL